MKSVSSFRPEPVRFLSIKRFFAKLLVSDFLGNLIGRRFGDRIPVADNLTIDSSSLEPKVKAAIFFGIYESAETKFIRNYLRSDLDVVELGSSIGFVSSVIARKLDPGKKLICVEANENVISSLKSNIQSFTDINIFVNNVAINCFSCDLDFITNKNNLVSSYVSKSDKSILEKSDIRSVRLSEILEAHSINDFSLVMDIEGAETGILLYDKDSLVRCQVIIAELHESIDYNLNSVVTVEKLVDLIKQSGFVLRAQRGCVCFFERAYS